MLVLMLSSLLNFLEQDSYAYFTRRDNGAQGCETWLFCNLHETLLQFANYVFLFCRGYRMLVAFTGLFQRPSEEKGVIVDRMLGFQVRLFVNLAGGIKLLRIQISEACEGISHATFNCNPK